MNEFSLAHLTVLSLPPPEMVSVAARTGYQAVGLRLIAVTADSPGYPLMFDPPAMRDTKTRLDDTGIRVGDIEFIKITPETDIMSLEPFAAAGAELEARHIIAAPYDPDLGRLAERFAALADLAGRYNLSVLLEFFPWTVVPDVRAAAGIVETADRNTSTSFLQSVSHLFMCATRRQVGPLRHSNSCIPHVPSDFRQAKVTSTSALSSNGYRPAL
jgi:sugar phosphate isomerase/epimerase